MPARLRPADPTDVAAALARVLQAHDAEERPPAEDLRLLVRHSLALLLARAPGRSVEVRVPPYAAIQCVPGPRHTRGTPPGVVETDPLTWVLLAAGRTTWATARESGTLAASGERTDLSAYLPLLPAGDPAGSDGGAS
ncbi:sterol carrier family protein [Actinopolymorpha singaporensis]|uniref:sterol carrier family protein n=1 Tax=Actinopolymorpha singaporensis TaxID=117157 RepID=UPI000B83DD05|nr:sterol carrier family protein [Actinopolymorpha singaporensis]